MRIKRTLITEGSWWIAFAFLWAIIMTAAFLQSKNENRHYVDHRARIDSSLYRLDSTVSAQIDSLAAVQSHFEMVIDSIWSHH